MSAIEALREARQAGVRVTLDGEDLLLQASARPPASVLDALARQKARIAALLRPGADGWTGEDWLAYFDERAGVAEFDGGLPRSAAEAQAFACCVAEWLNRNPARPMSGHCVECGNPDRPGDPLLPYGTEADSHVWLHSACWPAWHNQRQAQAIAALASMDITAADVFANGSPKGKGPANNHHLTFGDGQIEQ